MSIQAPIPIPAFGVSPNATTSESSSSTTLSPFGLPTPPRGQTVTSQLRKANTERKVFPWPPWTSQPSPPPEPSPECWRAITRIAEAICAVNAMALEYIRRDHEASLEFSAYHEKPIVQSYIGFVHGPGLLDVDGNTISALSPSERAEADIEILTAFKVEDVYSMGRTDIGKLLGCITNVEYERIWKELITRMHSELQDSCSPDMAQLTGRGSILWTFTMVNADQVLSNREKAARFFKDCWEELVELGFDMEVDDIFMKIKHLQSFDTVYNAKDPLHRPQIAEHARYLGNPSWGDSYRNSIGKKVTTSQKAPLLAGSKRNLEQERDANSKLAAILFAVIFLAFSASVPAYHYTSHQAPTWKSMDFWIQLQSSTMQLLSIFTALYPFWNQGKHSPATPWNWAIVYCIAGAVFSVVAIFVTGFVSTFWGCAVNFLATACQAVVVLQLALAVGTKEKGD